MIIKQSSEDFIVKEVPNFSLTPKGKYNIFLLKKKQWNTEDVLQKIALILKIPRKKISFCGTKDRQAVTEQYISINAPKEKVEKIQIKDVETKYIGRSLTPLSLGDNLGNSFEIIIRECKTKPKRIEKITNYFGEQRFSEKNVEIGKAIVTKDFKKTVELLEIEAKGSDYVGAIKTIPLKTAKIYPHSYQSKLWNEVASKVENKNEIPLIGFATEFEDKEIESIYYEIMQREGIELKDFIIKQWPELSCEGATRKQYIEIENLKIEKIDKKTYKLKFFLPKGCYATEAIKQIVSL